MAQAGRGERVLELDADLAHFKTTEAMSMVIIGITKPSLSPHHGAPLGWCAARVEAATAS
jgi:hypothetical protein